jgi:tetratricopeptide (TPR) repeat protein
MLAENDVHEHARRFFRRAIEIDPSYTVAARNLGLSFFSSGSYDEARRALRSVLDVDPRDPPACRILAEIARKFQDWRLAAAYRSGSAAARSAGRCNRLLGGALGASASPAPDWHEGE